MRELFKGWRRKMGFVMLGLACVFAAGWVRSQQIFDASVRNFGGYRYMVTSFDGMIDIGRTSEIDGLPSVIWNSGKLSQLSGFEVDDNGARRPFDPWKSIEVDWKWDCGRFHIGAGKLKWRTGTLQVETCIIPYWSIVIPLTLISFLLLISHPRTSSQKKTVDPVPVGET